MKKKIDTITAVPSKNLFLSIIADYDLNRSICELIDNALDIWIKTGKNKRLKIEIKFDTNQQSIEVEDNAGGVKESDLEVLISPGKTQNVQTDETIGFFGVGTKRAVVALAQDISILSRYRNENTYLVEYDDEWLKTEEWDLDYYQIDNIEKGTTKIKLHKLRLKITKELIESLIKHLETTYAKFIEDEDIVIIVDRKEIVPKTFENWAYPPKFSPRRYIGEIKTEDDCSVNVEVIAGLAIESSPAVGEYGVYFYCNDRLVARGLKTFDVGFTKGLAGVPHPNISLTKVIVNLKGEARFMPWNSSKSGINPNHHIFISLRKWLVRVVKDYASLSRRWVGRWPEKVFKYDDGEIIEVEIDDFPEATKSYLPDLPKMRKSFSDVVKEKNKKIVKDKPWTNGLYEGIIAVDTIFKKKKLKQKNRVCLIILDSTLEIAFKEYLVNDSGTRYSNKRLLDIFNNRNQVHDEIKKHVRIKQSIWQKINYYYNIRCDLIHKKVTDAIKDSQVEDFQKTVEYVLRKLFKLEFEKED